MQTGFFNGFNLGLCVRVGGDEIGMDNLAVELFTRRASNDHQFPGFERAMVGHADACGQDGVKMRWINLANRHGLGGDGPACGQKGNHIWHKTSLAGGRYNIRTLSASDLFASLARPRI